MHCLLRRRFACLQYLQGGRPRRRVVRPEREGKAMSKQGSAIRGLVFAASVTAAVQAMATAGDLRDINVGMEISSVPDAGYINLTCVGEKTHRLAEWAQWAACPAGPDQLRGIRFEYDRETAREGTMVGGHPAILTVMID